MTAILQIIVLIISVIVHEVAHGAVAERLGDPTARDAGRLTLNPIPHIDLFGSIIIPALLVLSHSPVVFGWAKPVPYDPRNLKDPKSGAMKIALAGPLTNLGIAVVFGIALRIAIAAHLEQFFLPLVVIVVVNLMLGIFNLVPIPPLDGSKLLGLEGNQALQQFGPFLLIMFLLWGGGIVVSIVQFVSRLIVGVPLL